MSFHHNIQFHLYFHVPYPIMLFTYIRFNSNLVFIRSNGESSDDRRERKYSKRNDNLKKNNSKYKKSRRDYIVKFN